MILPHIFYTYYTGTQHFLYAAQNTDQGEESVLLLLVVGGFGVTVFGSPMFSIFKMGASRENFSSKWVYPEKTFLQNGCIQGNLFSKKSASSKNFSSKWVHS